MRKRTKTLRKSTIANTTYADISICSRTRSHTGALQALQSAKLDVLHAKEMIEINKAIAESERKEQEAILLASNACPIKPVSDDDFALVADLIKMSKSIVCIVGAGLSQSCGIPCFREEGGIYNLLDQDSDPLFKHFAQPENLFELSYFEDDPKPFYTFAHKHKMMPSRDILPSRSHYFLKILEKKRKLRRVLCQNIDGLLERAGVGFSRLKGTTKPKKASDPSSNAQTGTSNDVKIAENSAAALNTEPSSSSSTTNNENDNNNNPKPEKSPSKTRKASSPLGNISNSLVLNVHGTMGSGHCLSCKEVVPGDVIINAVEKNEIPTCPKYKCWGATIRPDICFFGEQVPSNVLRFIEDVDIGKADLVLCIGTSLSVTPVDRAVNIASSGKEGVCPRILINKKAINIPHTELIDAWVEWGEDSDNEEEEEGNDDLNKSNISKGDQQKEKDNQEAAIDVGSKGNNNNIVAQEDQTNVKMELESVKNASVDGNSLDAIVSSANQIESENQKQNAQVGAGEKVKKPSKRELTLKKMDLLINTKKQERENRIQDILQPGKKRKRKENKDGEYEEERDYTKFDVSLIGDCDDVIMKICQRLGWEDELEEEYTGKPVPKKPPAVKPKAKEEKQKGKEKEKVKEKKQKIKPKRKPRAKSTKKSESDVKKSEKVASAVVVGNQLDAHVVDVTNATDQDEKAVEMSEERELISASASTPTTTESSSSITTATAIVIESHKNDANVVHSEEQVTTNSE